MSSDRWQVEYGKGGWARVTSSSYEGWLYLRLHLDNGRPIPTEMYYDARGGELRPSTLRRLPLANIVAFVADGAEEWLENAPHEVGADLSRLASHFATGAGWGTARHWVADSMRAQIPDSGVPQAKSGRSPRPESSEPAPEPLNAPEYGLTDAFLTSVARNYAWALRERLRPAPELARMAGVSPRTVHGWVSKARQRGIMPPASQGRVS
jgi:hypothetical protein